MTRPTAASTCSKSSILTPATLHWSRSFSSIYGEWETIGEAREINRAFHESVRFPAQENVFQLVMKKRGPANEFVEVWRITLDPADVLVHRESAMYADHVVAIHESGDPATKVDLLLLGDGYTAEEFNEFIAKARELTEVLIRNLPVQRTQGRLQRLGARAAGTGIRRLASVDGHLPRFACRHKLRRISFRTLCADHGQ